MIINIKQKERVTKSLDSMYDTFCDLECETTDEAKQCVYKQHYSNLRYIKLYVEELHGEIDRLNELLKEKQPKKVKDFQYLADLFIGKCPSCGEELNNEVYPAFCGFCGQRISWKDGEQE